MFLHQTPLFKNTTIDTNSFQIKHYTPRTVIEIEGNISSYIGIVLEGTLSVTSYTISGNPIQISTITEGMSFGDVLIYCSDSNIVPGNIISQTASTVAIIPNDIVEYYLQNNMSFMRNFLTLLSDKVYEYNMNSKLLSQDTIRDKILFFLRSEISKQKTKIIQLNMTKQDMANLLHIQRPSLSRELIHMRNEGILDFDRWTITLNTH